MKTDIYFKLQKRYGGRWVATSKSGRIVYAAARQVKELFDQLKQKHIHPKKTAIGYIQSEQKSLLYEAISSTPRIQIFY